MDHYSCIIQEGQVADRQTEVLEAGLKRLAREFFDDDPDEVNIRWTRQAAGWAWTAGEPSTSSIVVRSVPVGYDDVQREAFLRAVCDLWVESTGCSINEIVATAFDGPLSL
ncbi:MAG: hypothetical protein AAF430_22915 [Myxococcota bacterium]